ncbi:hypothetical protein [Nocardia wallacei]|uniref:Uncharacterized protein n=1 Tax=Nocardia wallacei TaxID=480035 RepID=A0A7G1KV90_9NOCA|nr:hypothetical protein [Nocardia wallacei]BCK57044.1 hypothetical protein NWFMUON74_48160 [Nocardia wallacei]
MSERSERDVSAATSVLVLGSSVSEVGAVSERSERSIDAATSVLVPEASASEVEA